jgi:hypothetical protein
VPRRLFVIVVFAVAVPLLAAIMSIFLLGDATRIPRMLVAALIFLGIAGLPVVTLLSRVLSRVVTALTGTKA